MESSAPKQKFKFAARVDYSYKKLLSADPESAKYAPNKSSRQVKSGHYVPVKPTPLPAPRLIIFSEEMAKELDLSKEECQSSEFASFFSGDVAAIPEFSFQWATPYALAIYGQEMYQQDPFRNGRGYGDGRAISIAEVLMGNGKRWEMQLKGAGKTPFARTGDGRAVLRSSVREFLASEAMHHLGVRTTRALSLVVSLTETVDRPWFSSESKSLPSVDDPRIAHLPLELRQMLIEQYGMNSREPDKMQTESCAITCRVASSFVRVGHLDLFARRARGDVPGITGKEKEEDARVGLQQLKEMVSFALFREFPAVTNTLDFLRSSSARIAELTANWIRVGFCQGNFNSDNCLVSGTQMDYGPFGFIEKFEPFWNMWTGGGKHFAFMNQPNAGHENFKTLVKSVKPTLSQSDADVAEEIASLHFETATNALNEVWRKKLGLGKFGNNTATLVATLLNLMEVHQSDYTLTFRQLAKVLSSPENAVEILKDTFYTPLSGKGATDWTNWIKSWISLNPSVELMNSNNPKYVPREWMLVSAYEKANNGDYGLVKELYELFKRPFDEQPEYEHKYYRKAPQQNKPGTSFMS